MKKPSVRFIIITVVGTLLAVCVGFLSFEFDRGMRRLLAHHEEDLVQQHAHTASVLLRSSLRSIADATRDWSRWDETYTFVNNQNSRFLDDELNNDLFMLYKLNVAIIFNKSNEIVYQRFFNFATATDEEPDADMQKIVADFQKQLTQGVGAVQKADLKNGASLGISGLIRQNDTWIYLSAFPILTSSGKGDPNGVLLFGRKVNEQEIRRIEKGIGAGTIQRLPSAEADKLLAQGFFTDSQFLVDYSTKGFIKVFHTIDTAYGPPLVIFIEEVRTVYNQGISMIRDLNLLAALTAALGLVLLFFLLEVLLLRPLNNLAKYVAHLNDISERPEPPRH